LHFAASARKTPNPLRICRNNKHRANENKQRTACKYKICKNCKLRTLYQYIIFAKTEIFCGEFIRFYIEDIINIKFIDSR